MSRLGGGIGTRDPGEKKIETDRRLIRDRISKLSADLKDMKEHRDVQRSKRAKTSTPVAAIVGYTNAGKSTLLNKLTDAGVLSENKLLQHLTLQQEVWNFLMERKCCLLIQSDL